MPEHTFLVDHITEDGLLFGCNGSSNGYADIPVGTVFVSVMKTRVDGDLLNLETVDLGTFASIHLVLREVHFYRKKIDVIPGGHSASIRVEGEGLAELAEIIQSKGTREFVRLCAVENT